MKWQWFTKLQIAILIICCIPLGIGLIIHGVPMDWDWSATERLAWGNTLTMAGLVLIGGFFLGWWTDINNKRNYDGQQKEIDVNKQTAKTNRKMIDGIDDRLKKLEDKAKVWE